MYQRGADLSLDANSTTPRDAFLATELRKRWEHV
jgi:hypothetical protein